MRILFISDNFPPETNAPAVRTLEHCREWVALGAKVTVLTCVPNFPVGRPFPGYRNRLLTEETIDGIEVLRVWSYMAPNAGFARRILDHLSFAITAFFAGLRVPCDVIVATSPQFFTSWAACALARARRLPWVFEVRDLWPESIIATGAMREGGLTRALERVELALYHDAAEVIVVTHAFKKNLVCRGVGGEKIVVVPNGVSASEVAGRDGMANVVERERTRPFLVGYVGTHGMAHGLEVVLEAAARLKGLDFRFLLVGEGAEKRRLVALAAERALQNVKFEPAVAREEVPAILARLDAVIVPLRDRATFRTVIPSKIFEAAAACRPILLGVAGEAQELIERYGAGLAFQPEDADGLQKALVRLAGDAELYAKLQGGCWRLARDYDRKALATTMYGRLRTVAAVGVGGRMRAEGGAGT